MDKLSAAIKKALADPDVLKRIADVGLVVRYETPEQLAAHCDKEDPQLEAAVPPSRARRRSGVGHQDARSLPSIASTTCS